MARSDTIRSGIASLEDKKAGYAKVVAAQGKIAAAAREAARKKRGQASRSKAAAAKGVPWLGGPRETTPSAWSGC